MLVKNLNVNEGLVNGARGVIKGFETGNTSKNITAHSKMKYSYTYFIEKK
jgi:hypothetical protein